MRLKMWGLRFHVDCLVNQPILGARLIGYKTQKLASPQPFSPHWKMVPGPAASSGLRSLANQMALDLCQIEWLVLHSDEGIST